MESVIHLSDISFNWKDNTTPLFNIPSLTIQKGEKVLLQGRSGSGKSTFLHLIGGFLSSNKGKVSILDHDLSVFSPAEKDQFRADHVGYIFQQFNLIPYLSVIENVVLPLRFSTIRKSKVRKEVNTEAEKLLLKLGITVNLHGSEINTLSVGQQQRVAAARAFIGHPEIILADEPTSALDSYSKAQFMDVLLQLCKENNATLIMVSHDETLTSYFDQILPISTFNSTSEALENNHLPFI
ncbi:ABC transporter ATP-binding protein [Flammeovirga agarivorans]|uniref:ABC transporter ATP-binding protein n=1 Tax=Flammeovirga agarivorans TaxID=2726742 RepID=A0A7X8XW22_9BACT|nr:ABC transporter ATP-binding protein [Flammeovirga agarivorans]NLR91804.1 ABC transporter ATP-binding protein [Flammeovirga agarivorans]